MSYSRLIRANEADACDREMSRVLDGPDALINFFGGVSRPVDRPLEELIPYILEVIRNASSVRTSST